MARVSSPRPRRRWPSESRAARGYWCARIFNPIGPGMPRYLALGEFARQIAALPPHGGMLQTGSLTVSRDFIDVEDVASALHRLATHPLACGVVNICSGKPTRLDGLVECC